MTTIRHKLLYRPAQYPACSCGYDPAVILEAEGKDVFFSVAVGMLLDHLKKARRWKYLGLEFHYSLGYYIWENELTQKRWAIQEYDYLKLTGVSRNPRLEVRWTA